MAHCLGLWRPQSSHLCTGIWYWSWLSKSRSTHDLSLCFQSTVPVFAILLIIFTSCHSVARRGKCVFISHLDFTSSRWLWNLCSFEVDSASHNAAEAYSNNGEILFMLTNNMKLLNLDLISSQSPDAIPAPTPLTPPPSHASVGLKNKNSCTVPSLGQSPSNATKAWNADESFIDRCY